MSHRYLFLFLNWREIIGVLYVTLLKKEHLFNQAFCSGGALFWQSVLINIYISYSVFIECLGGRCLFRASPACLCQNRARWYGRLTTYSNAALSPKCVLLISGYQVQNCGLLSDLSVSISWPDSVRGWIWWHRDPAPSRTGWQACAERVQRTVKSSDDELLYSFDCM